MAACVERFASTVIDEIVVVVVIEWRDRFPLAPLLKKEPPVTCPTLITRTPRPVGMHRPCAGSRCAASDDPVDFAQHLVGTSDNTCQRVEVANGLQDGRVGEILAWTPFAKHVDPREIHRPEKRLTTQKPHPRRDLQKLGDALISHLLILYAGANPDVGGSFPIKPALHHRLLAPCRIRLKGADGA